MTSKKLNKEQFSDITGKVAMSREKPFKIQKGLDSNPTSLSLQGLEKESRVTFLDLSKAEESFLRQKFRVQGLNLGD